MNFDDILNDHEDRLESLEESGGGGGATSASNVSYDDTTTSYGESTVQKVLEKIKSLFANYLPLSGGEVSGIVTFSNNVGIQGYDTNGNARTLARINANNQAYYGTGYNLTRFYCGSTNADGTQGENGYYVLSRNNFRTGGADMGNGQVDIGSTSVRFKTVYAINGNFSGDVTAANIGATLESSLSSNYALSSANTVYSPLQITLPAGTWLLTSQVVTTKPSATRYIAGTVSTTNKDTAHTFSALGNTTIEACASTHQIVTIASETTYYLSIACNNTGVSLTTASKLSAVRIK